MKKCILCGRETEASLCSKCVDVAMKEGIDLLFPLEEKEAELLYNACRAKPSYKDVPVKLQLARAYVKGETTEIDVKTALQYFKEIADAPESEYSEEACKGVVICCNGDSELSVMDRVNLSQPYLKKYNELLKKRIEKSKLEIELLSSEKERLENEIKMNVERSMEDIPGSNAAVDFEQGQYVGQLKDGKRDGFGVQYDNRHRKIYEGEWLNDKRHGYGRLFSLNGSCEFEGWFKNGLRHGKGSDGSEWRDGERIG